jgi:hypothetical protein
MILRNVHLVCAVLVSALVAGCGPNPEVEACVARGVEYYKEIGSYPVLKTAPNVGRPAEEVARKMCRRSPVAFSM